MDRGVDILVSLVCVTLLGVQLYYTYRVAIRVPDGYTP